MRHFGDMTHLASSVGYVYTLPMSAEPTANPTPLVRSLQRAAPRAKPTPLDLFQLARKTWLAGERVEIGALATQLEISRATAFRWVGSRDQLLGEVLWSLCSTLLERATRASRARGAVRVAEVCGITIRAIVGFAPLRQFVRTDPEYALRLLTSKQGSVQGRCIDHVRQLLLAESATGLGLPLPVDTLAYLLVRVCEAFIYADVISGHQVDVADANLAVQLLLSGQVSDPIPRS